MSPTQQQKKDFLFDKVTSRYVLQAAWQHVRPRLEKSKDEKIRADAASFAANVNRSVTQLQSALRGSTFKFEPQKGVLKKRKSEPGKPAKEPRPIVVAPAKNRIVQRAILDICQSDETATQKRLGKLVEVIQRETSVGGLPERGVPEAIIQIKAAMSAGATWYVRSDLKNFFQAVPKTDVQKFLEENIKSDRFNRLFMDALSTELSNEDEVRDLMRLFPTGSIGVPQGSALSALCANIVLSDFDHEYNKRNITAIRYLDDFVLLGKGKNATEAAFKSSVRMLARSGFECHDPFSGSSAKASAGAVADGFEFLSFRISPTKIIPTRTACAEFLEDIRSSIAGAKSEIIGHASENRRAQPRYVQALALLDKKIRGWGDAFSPTSDRLIFEQLDSKLGEEVDSFQNWFFKQVKNFDARGKRRAIGIALLADTSNET